MKQTMEQERKNKHEKIKDAVENSGNFRETTFRDVVLGAVVWYDGDFGQKIDEPIEGRNKYGQHSNFTGKKHKNIDTDDMVKTTYYSLKSKPELRHK